MIVDCANCTNCDFIRGFMCTCHYSYDTETSHIQVGQDVHRNHAAKCDHYTDQSYNRDTIFII